MNFLKRPFHHPSATNSTTANTTSSSNTNSTISSSSVRFSDLISHQPKFNEREKYLTAKYPQQQMQLIRKRLKVEFWLDDQLRFLYDLKDDCSIDDHDHCPGDLIDSLLDLDDDSERRRYLLEKLTNVKQDQSTISEFIDEFLQRVKML